MRWRWVLVLVLVVGCAPAIPATDDDDSTTSVDDDDSTTSVDDDDSTADDDDDSTADDDDSTGDDDDDDDDGTPFEPATPSWGPPPDPPSEWSLATCSEFAIWDDPSFGCTWDYEPEELCDGSELVSGLSPTTPPYCPAWDAWLLTPGEGWSPSASVSFTNVSALSPSVPVDYLELRQYFEYEWDDTSASGPFGQTAASTGTVCSNATDPTACMAAYSQLLESSQGSLRGAYDWFDWYALIYTRGDTVGSVGSAAEAAQFLAPLDAADAAFVWGAHRDAAGLSQVTTRTVPGAIELASTWLLWSYPVRGDAVVIRFPLDGSAWCTAAASVDFLECGTVLGVSPGR